MVLRQIDEQLNQFNNTILKVVNNHKVQILKAEFDHLEKYISFIHAIPLHQQSSIINVLANQDSIHQVIKTAVIYKKESKAQHLIIGAQAPTFPIYMMDTVLYTDRAKPQLEIYKTHPEGIALYIIDLLGLQHYLEQKNLDGRSYFELYDLAGNCLLNPDISKIGLKSDSIRTSLQITNDTIVQSEYLQLPVKRNTYILDGILGHTFLIVDAPFMMTDVEMEGIGSYTLLLSISGIILMCILLYILNRERTRSERLTIQNLQYQKEEAILRFENLKQKFDPHFLFNALGSLQQLIGKDPSLAQTFVGKLARVYRKFLHAGESNLSTLHEELHLAKAYFFLQKIRFGNALREIDWQIDNHLENKRVPKFALQILIENAIKHNEISDEKPLTIRVYSQQNYLIVENDLSPRVSTETSTGYGTLLISKVYDYYHMEGFEILKDEKQFKVVLPIIS